MLFFLIRTKCTAKPPLSRDEVAEVRKMLHNFTSIVPAPSFGHLVIMLATWPMEKRTFYIGVMQRHISSLMKYQLSSYTHTQPIDEIVYTDSKEHGKYYEQHAKQTIMPRQKSTSQIHTSDTL